MAEISTDWRVVESQKDADALMEELSGFHDCFVTNLRYDANLTEANGAPYGFPDKGTATVILYSQWAGEHGWYVELEFSGNPAFCLQPEFSISPLYSAEIKVVTMPHNGEPWVVMVDEDCGDIEPIDFVAGRNSSAMFVLAQSLRWRYLRPREMKR